MSDICLHCGQYGHPENPLKDALPFGRKVELLRAAEGLGKGRTRIPNPPVYTGLWEDEDWVKWVDAHGVWVLDTDDSADTPEDNPFERDL